MTDKYADDFERLAGQFDLPVPTNLDEVIFLFTRIYGDAKTNDELGNISGMMLGTAMRESPVVLREMNRLLFEMPNDEPNRHYTIEANLSQSAVTMMKALAYQNIAEDLDLFLDDCVREMYQILSILAIARTKKTKKKRDRYIRNSFASLADLHIAAADSASADTR